MRLVSNFILLYSAKLSKKKRNEKTYQNKKWLPKQGEKKKKKKNSGSVIYKLAGHKRGLEI